MPLSAGATLAEATSDQTSGPPGPRPLTRQSETVVSGDTPATSAEVTLYQAGKGEESAPRRLGRARSDGAGRSRVAHRRPADPSAVLYLTVDSGRPAAHRTGAPDALPVRLVTALGAPGGAEVNARTTVAAGFALAQFTERAQVLSDPHPGLQNAAAVSHHPADIGTGKIAKVLVAAPNGHQTSAPRTFISLADILAGCTAGYLPGRRGHRPRPWRRRPGVRHMMWVPWVLPVRAVRSGRGRSCTGPDQILAWHPLPGPGPAPPLSCPSWVAEASVGC
ncbi:hypothetical protein [Streptomyces sp. NPDC002044]|uniref:hypothetical protein n=1 Tax=Streptomyces sp. NPDC002044 TaxID=3154662 RepID=UPI003316D27A